MNLAIRLTWQHDPDLIGLHMHPDFDLPRAIKEVLCAYTKGEYFSISLPGKLPPLTEIKNCTVHISLGEITDADVIKKVLEIKSGFRNTAIKNVFRTYLDNIYLYPIHIDADTRIANRVSKKRVNESRKPDDLLTAAKKAEKNRIEIKKSEKVSIDNKGEVKGFNQHKHKENKNIENQKTHINKGESKRRNDYSPKNAKPSVKPSVKKISNPTNAGEEDDFDLFGAIGKIGG